MASNSRRRRGPERTVHVPRTAVTSSAKILDFVALPVWLYIPYRIGVFWIKRFWWLIAIIICYFMVGKYWTIPIILFLLSIPIAYVWAFNRHHTFTAILRATRYLISTKHKWRWTCEQAEINNGPKCPRLLGLFFRYPPKIVNERGTSLEFLINLKRVGMTVEHLEQNKDYVSTCLGARRTSVVRLTPGICRLTVEWEKNILKSTVAKSVNDTILPRVELDSEVLLELETSTLVVGMSGTGKSNLTWYILNELNKLKLLYRLYVVDPKKVELAELVDSPSLVAYADDISEIDAVIEQFYNDMMDTFARMKPLHLRRAPLGPDWPLHMLIIDEILLCDQARQGVDTHLAKILTAGRAAGFIIIADSQLGQVDALTRLRDLFPQRICFKVNSSELTAAVLGPKCEERGARCTEITEPGVGYVWTDFAGAFMRFKLILIQGVSEVAAGNVWEPPKKRRRRTTGPCYVYHLRGRTGILLYVGIGFNPNERIMEHKDDKPWFGDIDHSRTFIRKYPSEQDAREAEQHDIENLHPLYNLVHNHKDHQWTNPYDLGSRKRGA